jgi:hypothetical protein
MSALAAAGIASAALGAYKVYTGAKQTSQGKQLAKNNVFQQEQLPGQVKLATNLAAQNYYNGMPGTAKAQQLINQNSANAFYNGSQGASSGGDLLDLASRINYGQNVATNDLAYKGADYKAQALGGYENALNNEGQWEDKLYNNNVLQPYLRTANTASALQGAGNMNTFSGLDQIGTAALSYAQGVQKQNKYPAGTTMQDVTGNPTLPTASQAGVASIPSSPALSSPAYMTNVIPGTQPEAIPYTGIPQFNAANYFLLNNKY